MNSKPFIVAELSANHLGDINRAIMLIDAAHQAGADAIKLQTFTPEQMAEPGVIVQSGPWAGRELLDLYRETHTPREWHRHLFAQARHWGMVPFSSVFHPDDVAFLETLDCPIYKIASFELTDLDLIRCAARTGKPMIISTGMGTEDEIGDAAYDACEAGCTDLTLLKCSSAYPAPVDQLNLRAMRRLTSFPQCNATGFSDHTLGHTCAVAATVLGASVIEKHLTLSRADGGPDAAFSAEPDEFAAMVKACREAAAALGGTHFGPTSAEASSVVLRRASGGRRGS